MLNVTGATTITGSTGAGLDVENSAGMIGFAGPVTINNSATAGAGIDLLNNAGATISFTGGLDIDTTTGTGFNATGGGTVSVTNGVATNTITTTNGTALVLDGVAIGGTGITFNSIASTDAATDGITLDDVTGGTLSVTGTTTITNPGDAGIDILGTNTATFTFADVDISLGSVNTTGLDLNGAVLNTIFTATDFDVTATAALAGTRGIDLRGATTATMGQINLGDAVVGTANGASIGAGVAIGVDLSNTTAINLTFGDGEQATDRVSTIGATIQINAPAGTAGGSYNFADVGDFDIARIVLPFIANGQVFVAQTATGDGSGVDLANLANVATADAITAAGTTFVLVNDGNTIVDADGFTLSSDQDIDGFGNGNTFQSRAFDLTNFTGLPNGVAVLNHAGGAATLDTGGAAFDTVTLGGNNSVANVIIQTTNAGVSPIASNGVGGITLGSADGPLVVTGGLNGVEITNLTGTLTVTNLEVSAAGNAGLQINGATGDNTIDIDRLVATGNGQAGLQLLGAFGMQSFATVAGDTLVSDGGGSGIRVQSTSGNFTFGAGTTLRNYTDSGLFISGMSDVSFAGRIEPGAGSAFHAPLSVQSHNGTVTFTAASVINNAGGGAPVFNDASGTYNLNGTTTLTGSNFPVQVLNSSGTITFGANTSITDSAATAFDITGGMPTVIYNGTISQNTAFSAVNILNMTGGSATFNGLITASTSTATGINLTNNAGATISFTGGLDIDTTTGTGFNATGGGTVSVTNGVATNTITTTNGTALNLNGVTIGATGITFESLTSTNAAGSGISIVNVDQSAGSAGFNVGAGGTNVTGATSHGINITGSSATFTFGGTTTVSGTTAGDNIRLQGANGAVAFGSIISDGASGNGLSILSATNNVTVSGGTFGGTSPNATNLLVQDQVSGDISLNTVTFNSALNTNVLLVNNAGTIGFTGGAISQAGANNNIALRVNGGSANINVGATITSTANSSAVPLTFASVVIGNTTGGTINFSADITETGRGDGVSIGQFGAIANTTINFLNGATTSNGGGTGIVIFNLDASSAVNYAASTSIQVADGDGVFISDNAGDVTISGTVDVTDTAAIGAGNGITLQRNTGNFAFNGAVTLNTAATTGVSASANAGAMISFTGGLDIDAQTGFAAGDGGTFTISNAGGVSNTIDATTGAAVALTNVQIGVSGINLTTVNSVSPIDAGINISNLTGGAFMVTGTTTITNPGATGIDISGTNTAAITFADVDISLGSANTTGLDLNGAVLNTIFTATDFDVTATAALADTRGIDLRGATTATMGQINLGEATVGTANGASIGAGVAIGVDLSNTTAINLTFGDGEQATDRVSTIGATIQINAPAGTAGGSYNFADVGDFDIARIVLPLAGNDLVFVAQTATGDGSGSDLTNLANAATADAITTADTTFVLVNDGNTIVDADGFTLSSDQDIDGFGNGNTVNGPAFDLTNFIGLPAGPTFNHAGGAATLDSNTANGTTLTLGNNSVVENVVVQNTSAGSTGGQTAILANGVAGITLGGADGPLIVQAASRGVVLDSITGTTTITNLAIQQPGPNLGVNFAMILDDISGATLAVDQLSIDAVNGIFLSGNIGTQNIGTAPGSNVDISTFGTGLFTSTLNFPPLINLTAASGDLTLGSGVVLDDLGTAQTVVGGGVFFVTQSIILNGGSLDLTVDGTVRQTAAGETVSGGLFAAGAGHTGTVEFTAASIMSDTSGLGLAPSLSFNDADGSYTFNGTTTITDAPGLGISIGNGSSGTFTFGANTSITNTTQSAILIEDSMPAGVTFNGTVTQNNAANAVEINNVTGGTIAFNGLITANTGTVTGIDLTNNAGATFSFTGGLDIDTTTGAGFDATGGGIINVTNGMVTNSINSTSGTALHLNGITIGDSGITFSNLASDNSPGDGVAIVNVDQTVASTGFNVGAGGTTVFSPADDGIFIDSSPATFNFGGTTTVGGAGNSDNIHLDGANGPITFNNIVSDAAFEDGIEIQGSTSNVTVNGGTFGGIATNDFNVFVENQVSGTITFNNVTFGPALTDNILLFDNNGAIAFNNGNITQDGVIGNIAFGIAGGTADIDVSAAINHSATGAFGGAVLIDDTLGGSADFTNNIINTGEGRTIAIGLFGPITDTDFTFSGTTISDTGGGFGIGIFDLDATSSAVFAAGTTYTATNTANTPILILNNVGDVTFGGPINITNSASQGVFLRGNSGTYSFNGPVVIANPADAGVAAVINPGATFNFTGGLDIDAVTGSGFFGVRGGTFNISGTNTIDITGAGESGFILGDVAIGATGVIIDRVTATGTGANAISGDGIKLLLVTGGSATFNTVNIAETNGAIADGIEIDGGTSNFTFGTVTLANLGDEGIEIENGYSGTATFTGPVMITNATTNGIGIEDTAGPIAFNDQVTITNPGAVGVDLIGTITGGITFADLDIALGTAGTTALDLNGAVLNTTFTATDFDVTATAALAGTRGIDLRGATTATMGQINLGEATVGTANGASIGAGVAIGVDLSNTTAINLTFGDGEQATDRVSTIGATIQINAPAGTAGGSYNFADVGDFDAARIVLPLAGNVVFVAQTATGDGSGSDLTNLANAATADAITTAGTTFALVNDGNTIVDADGFTLSSDQDIDGFGNGNSVMSSGFDLTNFVGLPGGGVAINHAGGAATLDSNTADGTTLTLGNNSVVENVIIQNTSAGSTGGQTAILANGVAGITLGGADGPLIVQAASRGVVLDSITGTTTITNLTIQQPGPGQGVNVAMILDDISGATLAVDQLSIDARSGIILSGNIGTQNIGTAAGSSVTVSAFGPGIFTTTFNLAPFFNLTAASGDLTLGSGFTLNDLAASHGVVGSTLTIGAHSIALQGGSLNLTVDGTIQQTAAGEGNSGGLFAADSGHTGTVEFTAMSVLSDISSLNSGVTPSLIFNNADGSYTFSGTTTITDAPGRGIDIRNGSSGTFTFGANTAITDPGSNGIRVTGSVPAAVTYNGTITQNNAATAVLIDGVTGGTIAFNGLIRANTSTATGINLTNNAGATINIDGGFDITTTTGIGFNATGGGTIHTDDPAGPLEADVTATAGQAINLDGITAAAAGLEFSTVSSTGSATTGISINNVGGGTVTLGNLDEPVTITNPTGDGISLSNNTANILFDGSTNPTAVTGAGGDGVDLNGNTGTVTFDNLTVDGSTGAGLRLEGSTGSTTVTAGAIGATTTNGGGVLIDGTGGSGDVTIGATIRQTSAFNALNIQDRTGGTVDLTGLITANTSTANGIQLTNNTNAAINIDGGFDITTTTGIGFNATGGGTIHTDDPAGPLEADVTATAGQAINLDGITAAAAGLEFSTVSSTGSATTGISINNVGGGTVTLGNLDEPVTITNPTGDGISLSNNTANILFDGSTNPTAVTGAGGDGVDLNGNTGTVTFDNLTVDGSTGAGLRLEGSTGSTTVTAGAIGATTTNGGGVLIDGTGGSGNVTIGATITQTSAFNALNIQDRTGGTVDLTGLITANTSTANGIQLTNNTNAAINIDGGFEITTTTGIGFNATGGGVIHTDDPAGVVEANVTATAGQAINLDGITIALAGMEFSDVSSTGSATTGISINNVDGGTFSITANDIVTITNPTGDGIFLSGNTGDVTFSTVSITNPGSAGVDIEGTTTGDITFTDLDIALGSVNTTGLDLNGAVLNTTLTATDFDVTAAAALAGTRGIDLRGATTATMGQILLGEATVGTANGASIGAGITTGIDLSATTAINLTFGDGESATDTSSSILADLAVTLGVVPAGGSYDLEDVAVGLNFLPANVFFVDADGATGGGDGSGSGAANPATLAAVEAAAGVDDIIVLVNNGTPITSAGTNADNTLTLMNGQQLLGFGDGAGGSQDLALAIPGLAPAILLSSPTVAIADPTGNGAAVLTTSAGNTAITLGAMDNRISGFTLDGQNLATGGIVDNGGATNTTIETMDVQNFVSTAIEITPSTNTTINSVDFLNNGTDVFLNAANTTLTGITSTGATGTAIRITNATGTTTLTNVSIDGAGARGLHIDNAAGTVNADNVDILNTGNDGILIQGGTATFDFDAASSLTNVGGAGFVLNDGTATVTFNGTITDNAGTAVNVQDVDAGATTTFTGLIIASSGTSTAIQLTNNSTAVISFNGGLDITTTTGTGFSADSGAINVANGVVTNTITTGNATALDLSNVTVNVTFSTITTSNTGRNSINLENLNGTVTVNGGTLATVIDGTSFRSVRIRQNDAGATRALTASFNGLTITHDATATSGVSEEDGISGAAFGDDTLTIAINNTTFRTEDSAVRLYADEPDGVIVTSFLNNVLQGDPTANNPAFFNNGVSFVGVTFDADIATAGNQQVNAGSFTAGAAMNPVVNGLFLMTQVNVDGPFLTTDSNLGTLVINDYQVVAANIGLNVTQQTGLQLTINGGSIDARSATLTNSTGDITLSSLDLTNLTSATPPLSIDTFSGSFTVTGNTALQGQAEGFFLGFANTTAGLSIQNSSANFQFAALDISSGPAAALGLFTQTNGGVSNGILLNNNTGTFTATGVTTIGLTARDAISITDQTGNVSFAAVTLTDPGTPVNLAAPGVAGSGIGLSGNGATFTFGDVNITNAAVSGVRFNGLTGGSVAFNGTTTITNPGATGIDISGTNTATFTFADVDISLGTDSTTGFDMNGATQNANVTVTDFDLTSTSATGTVGIDLRGATGTGTVTLGDTVAAAAASANASIAGVATGVILDDAASLTFIFGDSEGATDTGSSIAATTAIDFTNDTGATGTYNLLDVTFPTAGSTANLQGPSIFVFDDLGTAGAGTFADPGTALEAENAVADVLVAVDSTVDGASSLIDLTAQGNPTLNLDDGQVLISLAANQSIDVTTLGIAAGGAPANIMVTGIASSTTITEPGGPVDAAFLPTLTTAGANNAIAFTGSAGIGNVQVQTTGTGNAINGVTGATNETVHINNVTVIQSGGRGIAIDGSAAGTLTIASFSGNTVTDADTGGIDITDVTFDSDTGTAGNQQVAAGDTSVGLLGNRVEGDGIRLNNVLGNVAFGALDIFNNNGTGLFVRDAGGKAGTFSISTTSGTINTTNGTAIDIDPVLANLVFGAVSSTNANGQGSSAANAGGVFLDSVDAQGGAASNAVTITTLDVTGSTGAGLQITRSTGTFSFGTTTINNAGTTGGGVSITAQAAPGDTLNLNFTNGLDIDTNSGTGFSSQAFVSSTVRLNVVNAGTETIHTVTGPILDMLNIDASGTGINFDTLSSSGVVNAKALDLDLDSGTFNGGNVTVAGTSGGSSFGVGLTGAGGAISFDSITIDNTSNFGLSSQRTGGSVTITTVDIDGTGGDGIFVSSFAPSSFTINGGSVGASASPTGNGVQVAFGSGDVTIAADITTTTAGAIALVRNRTGGTVTLSGDLSATGGVANGIVVQNNTGGTIVFSGTTKTISTGTNTGVTLSNNTGATINFTGGGLDIDTTTGTGFSATGGGTFTVQGAGNTITTAAAAGVAGVGFRSVDTAFGALGVTFASINVNAANTGTATNGIYIDNAGAAGFFTVNGGTIRNVQGADFSGGVVDGRANLGNEVQDADGAGAAVYVQDTSNITLSGVTLTDSQNFGIRGLNVGAVTLSNITINGAHGSNFGIEEGAVAFFNLTGTNAITGGAIGGGLVNNVKIIQATNTDMTLNVTGGTTFNLSSTANGNDDLQIIQRHDAGNVTVTVTGATFSGSVGDYVQVSRDFIGAIGAQDVTITNNFFNNNHPGVGAAGGGVIKVSTASAGIATEASTFNISDNNFNNGSQTHHGGIAIGANGDSVYTGTINGNTIFHTNVTAINLVVQQTGSLSVTANNNRFDNDVGEFSERFNVVVNGINTTFNLNAANNTQLDGTNGVAFFAANTLLLGDGAGNSSNVCLNLTNNNITPGGLDQGWDIRLQNNAFSTLRLPGLVTLTEAGAEAFLAAQNPAQGGFSPFVIQGSAAGNFTYQGLGFSCP